MDKIADLLEKLATKFGVTVEYLWPFLVAKMKIDWIADTCVSFICFVIGFIALRFAFRGWDVFNARTHKGYDDAPPALVLANTVGGGLLFVLGFITLAIQFVHISRLLTPEAAVIYDLLGLAK